MKGLVERAAQVDRLVVEQDILVAIVAPAGAPDAAHAEVAFNPIGRRTVGGLQFGDKVIEEGRFRAPESGRG